MPKTKRPARNPIAALEYCQSKLAKHDGSPPKLPKPRFEDSRYPALGGLLIADPPQAFELKETERLRDWLNYLTRLDARPAEHPTFDAQTAYLTILQVWLAAHGVHWPSDGVFAAEPGSGGRGRPVDYKNLDKRQKCFALSQSSKMGKQWTRIAQVALPDTFATDPRKAARDARDYANTYEKYKRDRPDMEDLLDRASELLGIEPEWSGDPEK